MIRVAIADDSAFTCRLLTSYIEESGECQVVGCAHDAPSTINLVRELDPDVLTLDLTMPGCRGLDLLRQVASDSAVAVVVISGVTSLAASATLGALEIGAVDFVLKYTPDAPVNPASLKREILAKVKTAALVRSASRNAAPPRPLPVEGTEPDAPRPAAGKTARRANTRLEPPRVVVIGSSTGGPLALRELLSELPPTFAPPCVVVQHLPQAFTAPFAAQLNRVSRLRVREAGPGDRLEPGHVFIASGGLHVRLRPHGRLEFDSLCETDLYRPSIDRAMASAAESYGPSSAGVVLTGMGWDGAEGLRRIRDLGGEAYVQDPASCVVGGMPERALEIAGADHVANPRRIGQLLAARSRS